MKWMLYNNVLDTTVYTKHGHGIRRYLHINTKKKTAEFVYEVFEYNNSGLIPQQDAEPNEWIKWSAAYGSWHVAIPELTVEDMQFAIDVLKEVERRQREEVE